LRSAGWHSQSRTATIFSMKATVTFGQRTVLLMTVDKSPLHTLTKGFQREKANRRRKLVITAVNNSSE
jgi:hypothetical protein